MFSQMGIHIVFGIAAISFRTYNYLSDLYFERYHHRESVSIPAASSVTQSLGHLLELSSTMHTEVSRASWRRTRRWPYPNRQYLHSSKCLIKMAPLAHSPSQHTHQVHALHCKARIFNIDLAKIQQASLISAEPGRKAVINQRLLQLHQPENMTYFPLP